MTEKNITRKKRELLKTPKLTDEEVAQLKSDDQKIRDMSLLALVDKSLPPLPKDHLFKMRERRDVELSMHAAFELIGGVPAMAVWAKENPGEFIKLYTRLLPVAPTQQANTQVIINTSVPHSALADVELTTNDKSMYDEEDDDE